MKQKSIKLNFIMNTILTISLFVFPLITYPYISRTLQPAGMGKVSFILSIITYFNMFAQLGIPTYGVRACAIVRDDKEKLTRTVHEILLINLLTTLTTYIVLFFATISIPRLFQEKQLVFVMSFTIILTSIGIEWLYKALEQYTYITIRSLVFKLISVFAIFLLIHSKGDYVKYGAIATFASSASYIINLINVHKYIGLRPIGNYNFKRHLKPVLIFFAMSIATLIYMNLDTVLLGFMKTDADVGYYSTAVKVKGILVSLVTSLGTVLLPRASYYIENGEIDSFTSLSKKAMNFVFISAIPLSIYFTIYAKNVIYLLSGSAFHNSILPMRIIMFTLLFIGMSNLTGVQMLVPLGRENIVLISEIIGGLINFGINVILIPKFSFIGAAIASVVTEFLIALIQYIYLRKEVQGLFGDVSLSKLIIANLLAAIASSWVIYLNANDFIILVISAILYFGVYYIVLLLTKEKSVLEISKQIKVKLIGSLNK